MTREDSAKWAKLYQAHADGKDIGWFNGIGWVVLSGVGVKFQGKLDNYRIQPKVIWVNEYGDDVRTVHSSEASANKASAGIYYAIKAVKYIEVVE